MTARRFGLLVAAACCLMVASLVMLAGTVGLSVTEQQIFTWRFWREITGAAVWMALCVLVGQAIASRGGKRDPRGIYCGPCADGIRDSLGCSLPPFCSCDQHGGNPMAGKRYGEIALADTRLDPPVEFELAGLRDDEPEVHAFIATVRADTALAARFAGMGEEDGAAVMGLVTKLIEKCLDNSDGVPLRWKPTPLARPDDAGDDWEPKFRGPDGELHPMVAAEKFLAFDEGSSRRRWRALTTDADLTVQLEALAQIARDLIAATAGRPTDGS